LSDDSSGSTFLGVVGLLFAFQPKMNTGINMSQPIFVCILHSDLFVAAGLLAVLKSFFKYNFFPKFHKTILLDIRSLAKKSKINLTFFNACKRRRRSKYPNWPLSFSSRSTHCSSPISIC
jgi:hypothetical protein